MAGIAYIYKRLWNPDLIIDTNGVLPNRLVQSINGKNKPYYEVKWKGTTQAGEELGTAAASVKDGTTTPFQITVVSSDVGDNRSTAAGFVHSVALIGVSTNSVQGYLDWTLDPLSAAGRAGRPQSTVEVVAMNGTTDVLSTRYYLWVDHAYACEWGTGATHDAEGNITIESPANTTLLTIAATYNESDGGVWHFPPDRMVKTERVEVIPGSSVPEVDGVILTGTFSGFDQELNDANVLGAVDTYMHQAYEGMTIYPQEPFYRWSTKVSKVLWSEALVDTAATYHIRIIQSTNRPNRSLI